MGKRKKIKFKKSFYFLLTGILFITIFTIGLVNRIKYHGSDEYKLLEKGYTEELVADVLKNKRIKTKLLTTDYNPKIVDFMKEKYYIDKNLNKYLEYYNEDKDEKLTKIVSLINTRANEEWYDKPNKADVSKGILMLVNKFNYLDEAFTPDDLEKISIKYSFEGREIKKEVSENFSAMSRAAKEQGLSILANSAYRTFEYQDNVYKQYKNRYGKNYAESYAARPGYSEHQTGLAIDVSTLKNDEDDFKDTEEYKWLMEHAHEYGFILRYPEGKEDITGYKAESWHFRYVGIEAAAKIKEENITFDEYYAYYCEVKK